MSKCPVWHPTCNNDMKCTECRFYPCDKSWRYARAGHPPYKSSCFRCKYAKAVPMGIVCGLKGGE